MSVGFGPGGYGSGGAEGEEGRVGGDVGDDVVDGHRRVGEGAVRGEVLWRGGVGEVAEEGAGLVVVERGEGGCGGGGEEGGWAEDADAHFEGRVWWDEVGGVVVVLCFEECGGFGMEWMCLEYGNNKMLRS